MIRLTKNNIDRLYCVPSIVFIDGQKLNLINRHIMLGDTLVYHFNTCELCTYTKGRTFCNCIWLKGDDLNCVTVILAETEEDIILCELGMCDIEDQC